MSEVWITHPQLTPGHDIKVLRAALGNYAGSGWQERADQSDPVVEYVPADPREAVARPSAPARVSVPDKPAPHVRSPKES